ncbi:hypothetical protein E3N88_34885 [Mikania micrantha]|uniref:Uncharacterized protein n=1 Tax=Mikania micrantha TaxID=192012 RepID=A0A5N6LZF4_9ASTR|nr:hypothetical protein E3N88_34885 [Mikania micrantha]
MKLDENIQKALEKPMIEILPFQTPLKILVEDLILFLWHLEIEQILSDRLMRFTNVELQDIKEARKRFDKADIVYSQGSGAQRSNAIKPGPRLLSRWLSSHYHGGVNGVARHTLNLLTSTIKAYAK